MALYPDRRSAALPALAAAQRVHGWCSPEAIEQVACVMRLTPAYLDVGGDLLRHARDRARRAPQRVRVHEHLLLAVRRRRAATRRSATRPASDAASSTCARSSASAPATSRRWPPSTASTSARSTLADVPQLLDDVRAGRAGAAGEAARAQTRRRPAREHAASSRRTPPREAWTMAASATEPILLFTDIDEPGLNTLAVYERRGGYESLRKALAMTPEEVLAELEASGLRGRGGAGFAMGKKVSFLPKGAMDKYLVCNADESEPGTFKDRELMQKSPHMLIEGIVIASYAAGANRSFIYIRGEYVLQADILDAALAEARDGRLHRRGHPRLRALALAGRAPRRRRLHLRRGDRPARLAGRQARQPAAEAAVPGQPGPLPGADADQQRRDARDRARRSSRMGGAEYAKLGVRDLDRHQARVGLRPRPAPRQLRDRARHPLARDHLRPRRRPAARDARSSAGSRAAPPRRC